MKNIVPVIAIDGISASGKGTLARRLARHFGFAHLDTGLLYRMVGVAVLRSGGNPENEKDAEKAAKALNHNDIRAMSGDPELRSEKASSAASKVAVFPAVRTALLEFQRSFAKNPPDGAKGAVLDGRDIGTVIVPESPVKIYVTADLKVRAERRYKELRAKGENVTEAAVLADMAVRDERDTTRAAVPTKPADDAVVLDTSCMNEDEVFAEALKLAEAAFLSGISPEPEKSA